MSRYFAERILIGGRVQAVGYRPFVRRLAKALDLTGSVRNLGGQVEILAAGEPERLAVFRQRLVEQPPPLARPRLLRVEPTVPEPWTDFTIDASASAATATAHLPPDYFVCAECLSELQNPAERRYRYPFINCTQCGPRYTLIDRLPYDRPHTAMAGFPLCPDCAAEYQDPDDRRYHAQPLACPRCGPRLCFRTLERAADSYAEAALEACIAALRRGAIVAVKGVGGYHLLCDATDSVPIQRLRERKPRPDKPLAVLVPWRGRDGLDLVRTLVRAEADELQGLSGPERPIVLARRRADCPLAETVAPGLGEVGLMLPYSPLHHLLADGFGRPLIATSANLSGEPVLTEAAEVETRLRHVADAFLHHDRPIRRPADDSVFRRSGGRLRPIRLGRGSAPVERTLPSPLPHPLLAVGGDSKNTVALAFDDRVVISPHLGELGTIRGEEVFARVIADLQTLYGVQALGLIHDAHPDYRSTRWAQSQGLPCRAVFHHHAHASALVGEQRLDAPSLVFTWDGTGYGEDGTIWGGEALLGGPGRWRRVASLRPFRLLGGELASRAPWRCALALCWEADCAWPTAPATSELLRQAWQRRLNCPPSSSAGRLFDAAAALIGLVHNSTYEGHAAMRLEAISEPGALPVALPLNRAENGIWITDWAPLLPALMDTRLSQGERASLFHASLAQAISEQAIRVRTEYRVDRVGLTGGVFQNRLLTESAVQRLEAAGFAVVLPEALPANDGGLSFGQIIEAGVAT